VPMLIYDIVVSPVLNYAVEVRTKGLTASFWSFIAAYYSPNSLGSGPLWFIEALLVFACGYTVWRLLTRARATGTPAQTRMPGGLAVLGLVLGLTVVTFLVRVVMPIGWETRPFHLQFPFFTQYIVMFVLGIVAYRRGWLATLTDATGRRWLWIAVVAILLFPVMTVLGGALEGSTAAFRGGPYWQSFAYALFESFVCLGMCLGLTTLFRRRYNEQGALGRMLSANAYTVYLIFTPVIVFTAFALSGVGLYPLLKFVLASAVALPLCFLIAHYAIRRIPLASRVL
jgi:glucans biosynthesis protein C